MKKLELKCIAFSHKSRKYNSYEGTIGKIAKNRINRKFETTIPHQKITTDTSEFKIYTTDENGKLTIKKAYLDPFLDMFNGEILSYSISEKPNFKSISDALNKAISITNDFAKESLKITNSDELTGFKLILLKNTFDKLV